MVKIHCAYDKLVPISEIKLNPKNRNKHPEEQILRLMEIIKYNGVRRCVTVSKRSGKVTVGHGRIKAMKRLGMKEIPVNFQDYESEDAEYADGVADNAIGLWAELDLAGINSDLGDLGPDFDLNMLGIKDFVLDIAEKLEPGCDEDEVPEAGPAYVVKGDVFTLGRHRLMCGDSTMIDDVERLMAGEKADMVFTDPPYGVGFQYNQHDDTGGQAYSEFIKEVWQNIQSLGCPVVLTPGNVNLPLWLSIDKFNMACWVKKNAMSPSAISHLNIFEIILLHGVKNRRNTDLLEYSVKQQKDVGDHPCPKLIDIVEDSLNSWGPDASNIFEPFCGSGTTLIASEKLNRSCFGMELDPKYCTVILDRWAKYAGGDPVRESDGKLWSKIKAEAMDPVT